MSRGRPVTPQCGHVHLRTFALSSMKVSRSNIAKLRHRRVLAGVLQIIPEIGHRSDKITLSWMMISASVSPLQSSCPRSLSSSMDFAKGNVAGAGTMLLTSSRDLRTTKCITTQKALSSWQCTYTSLVPSVMVP